ncbi:PIN domain-containing protein [Candidatus Pacearchaeota archaeon]|jgi:rRNA-processing protein FCF1|nr:PIN domain-containing protein [Candidatus Pacearchaeota archaeon]
MKYAVLDTNFILSAIRKKIDFFEKIQFMGFKILIPQQVIREIEKFTKSKPEAKLALVLLKNNSFGEIDLHSKNVDNGIVNLARKNENYAIATLDREMKNKIKNPKIVIRGERNLEII